MLKNTYSVNNPEGMQMLYKLKLTYKMHPKPNRPYELQEYDPAWKRLFSDAAAELKPIFGSNLVEIDHVGSTSIVGMVAKPQIDLLVVVKNLDEVTATHDALKKAGFTVLGRGYMSEDDEYITKDAADGTRLISVHTHQEGNPKIQDYKAFRDYLQENEEDRNLYITTKRGLYSTHRESIQNYYNGKKDTITAILSRAKAWASEKHV